MTVAEALSPDAALAGVSEDHRTVYRLLLTSPHTRDGLAARSGLEDRKLRAIIEDLRVLAAVNPHPDRGPLVMGYHPTRGVEPNRGLYLTAESREDADAILNPHASRIRALATALYHQAKAAEETFGPPATDDAVQTALFAADQALKAARRWSAG